MNNKNKYLNQMTGREKIRCSFLTSTLFVFVLLLLFGLVFDAKGASAQVQQDQIKQPSFLKSDEELKEVISDKIYLSEKKGEKRKLTVYGNVHYEEKPTVETAKLYFTDGQGKVLNTFNVYPNTNVVNCRRSIRYSKKYLAIFRSFRDGKKEVSDGFILNNEGKVLWHIPNGDALGYVFPNDITDNVLTIDLWRGYVKIFNINGVEKEEKYFSNQNDKKFPDLATPDVEDAAIWGGCSSSNDGNYIAIARSSNDIEGFENELTLLDSNGKVIFQNKDGQSNFNSVLKVCENPNLIVLGGAVKGVPSGFKHEAGHVEYFGFDFNGKLIWKVDGEKYYVDPRSLNGQIVNLGEVENNNGKWHLLPSKLTLNIATGEVK